MRNLKFLNAFLILISSLLILGSNNAVYALENQDKDTVTNMALKFAKYSDLPDYAALDWAEQNTIGKANANPYKNALLGKYDYVNASIAQFIPGIFEILRHKDSKYSIKSVDFKNANDATVIVKKDSTYTYTYKKEIRESIWNLKIWFKKINNAWKISDYFLLLVSNQINGKPAPFDENLFVNQNHFGVKFYDAAGTEFPY